MDAQVRHDGRACRRSTPTSGSRGTRDIAERGLRRRDLAAAAWAGAAQREEQGQAPATAITIVGNVEMFMYRKDITPTGADQLDDVLANAKAQNKSNFYGYVIRGKATNPVSSDSLPILWSFGGDVFDDELEGRASTTPNSIAAVKFLVRRPEAVRRAGAGEHRRGGARQGRWRPDRATSRRPGRRGQHGRRRTRGSTVDRQGRVPADPRRVRAARASA